MNKTLCVLLSAMCLAGTAQAADLMSVYHDAVGYDATFAAAKASLEAGRQKYPQGRAGLLPTIGISANTTWNESKSTLLTSPEETQSVNYNTNGWTATLTQPLFRWQNWSNFKQGELAVTQAEAQFAAARQDLILRVAQAYFDVLLAQDALEVNRAQRVAITQQLEAAKRNFEVGTATITDTNEAQARFDLATAAELAAENDLRVKRQALQAIAGKEPDKLENLKTGVLIGRPQPDDIGKWALTAQTSNLSVVQAQAGMEIARQEVGKQRAGHLPTLDLVATYGKSHSGFGTLVPTATGVTGVGMDNTSKTIGLQLAVPIFSGGYVVSKTSEAVALLDKAQADLDNARRQADLGARQAYLGVTSGLSQVKAYEAAVASSKASLDSNKLGYEVGIRINIDVLNAQSQLYDTRQKLMKARLDTLMAQLKLKAAAGNLKDDDLVAINAMLE
jgi:outer membrane protein